MNTLKTWFPIVSTGLAVFFAVLWLSGSCDKPTTKPDDNELWRERVRQRDEVIKVKDSIITALQALRATEKKEAKQDSQRLSIENRRLSVGYSRAKKDIQHLRDRLPEVNALVLAADSVIASKDSLYNREVEHRIEMERLYQIEIKELGEKNVVQVQVSQLLETKVTDLTNHNTKLARKLERKKTGNKILGGVSAGLAAALGVIILTTQ